MLAECSARGWGFRPCPTRRARDRRGRPLDLIEADDAAAPYKRMHRAQVGVLLAREASVRADPSTRWTSENDVVAIQRYVRYKAFFARIDLGRFEETYPQQLAQFEQWCGETACEGIADPRCFPLHVFSPSVDQVDLGSGCGRQRFLETYGPGPPQTHRRRLRWRRGPNHGRDRLHVAGLELPRGFHWDVAREGPHGGAIRVVTAREVWEVKRGGYLNIYPDAYIRGGRESRRVWPR